MKVSFTTWWQEFCRENGRDVYQAAARLRSYVEDLSGDHRSAFIGELAGIVCRRDGVYGAAAAVLEAVADDPACASLYSYLQGLTRADLQEQGQEACVLRILACRNPSAYADAITAFLFEKPVGMYYDAFIWTQWPDQPEVFGQAYVRYLRAVSPERVTGTLVIQGLMMRPEALAAVQKACLATSDVALWTRITDAVRHTSLPGITTQSAAD